MDKLGTARAAGARAIMLGAALAAVAMPAHAQQPVPQAVRERVNEIVAACFSAGGRLGAMTGQGRFVIPVDLTGDGRLDFVVSEGNVPCTGRPDLFRKEGQARIEVYAADGRRLLDERVRGYRLVAGRPAHLQLVRPQGTSVAELATADAAGTSAAAPPPSATPASAPTATSGAPAAGARQRFVDRCITEQRQRYPQMTAANARTGCNEAWGRVEAAVPVARLVMAALPREGEPAANFTALRSRLPGVTWGQSVPAQRGEPARQLGRWSGHQVWAEGGATPVGFAVRYERTGGDLIWEAAAALETLGARVTPLGCYHFGPAEVHRLYRVEANGHAPFALLAYDRMAPSAGAFTFQTVRVGLDGKVPTLAQLRAEHRDPPWHASCPF